MCISTAHVRRQQAALLKARAGAPANTVIGLAVTLCTLLASMPLRAADLPAAPDSLNATVISSSQINLSWHDNAGNETGFILERAADGGDWIVVADLPADTTAHADQDLSAGTAYAYRIAAYNSLGSSSPSAISAGTTLTDPALLRFAGHSWRVKDFEGRLVSPGPNYWSSDPRDIWIDAEGHLHLRIAYRDGRWYSTVLGMSDKLGYGTYRFEIESPLDRLDPNLVLGLFTWDNSAPEYYYREIDIEFAKWGYAGNPGSQYAVQPANSYPGGKIRFETPYLGEPTTHRFTWEPGLISFQSYQGTVFPPAAVDQVASWSFADPQDGSVPPEGGGANTHINLWLFGGEPPLDGQEVEIVISDFSYSPLVAAPIAVADSASLDEDDSVEIDVLANDSDPAGLPLSIAAVSQGSNGNVLVNSDDSLTYLPASNFNGVDSFNYTLTNSAGASASAAVSVTVSAVNDPPIATDDTATTRIDQAVVIDPLKNDWDVDNDPLAITALVAGSHGTALLTGDNNVTYTPAAGFVGHDAFTYSISDGAGGSDTATVHVTVNDLQRVHVGDLDITKSGSKRWTGQVSIRVHYADESPAPGMTASGNWSGGASGTASCTTDATGQCQLAQSTKGNSLTFTLSDIAGGDAHYEPGANHDSDADSDGTAITINKDGSIPGRNRPPEFAANPLDGGSIASGQPYSGTLADQASDPDNDPLNFRKLSGPAWLTVASDGTLGGTAAAASPPDSQLFAVEARDPSGLTAQADLVIQVTDAVASPGVHLGELVGTGIARNGGRWTAAVEARVHDANHRGKGSVSVTGDWSGAFSGPGSCTTDSSGICTIRRSSKTGNSVTFSIRSLSGTGLVYDAAANEVSEVPISRP